jgi:hypothetical protein
MSERYEGPKRVFAVRATVRPTARGRYETMLLEVTCFCGFQARGTEDEVVEQIQAHGLADHGQMSSRETILELAEPLGED